MRRGRRDARVETQIFSTKDTQQEVSHGRPHSCHAAHCFFQHRRHNPFRQLTIVYNKPVIPPRAREVLELDPLGFFSGVSTDERMNVGVPVVMRWLGFGC